MKNKNLTISASLKNYRHQGNGISLFVLNDRKFYCMVESLSNACAKKFAKLGGLDLTNLENCSTLKAITRAARKELWHRWEESYNMSDDLEARKELTAYIFLTAEYIAKNK